MAGHGPGGERPRLSPKPVLGGAYLPRGRFGIVRDISSPLGDWSSGTFGWEPRDNGEWRRDGVNLRKMWVCERDS